jgi:hypothetical protein
LESCLHYCGEHIRNIDRKDARGEFPVDPSPCGVWCVDCPSFERFAYTLGQAEHRTGRDNGAQYFNCPPPFRARNRMFHPRAQYSSCREICPQSDDRDRRVPCWSVCLGAIKIDMSFTFVPRKGSRPSTAHQETSLNRATASSANELSTATCHSEKEMTLHERHVHHKRPAAPQICTSLPKTVYSSPPRSSLNFQASLIPTNAQLQRVMCVQRVSHWLYHFSSAGSLAYILLLTRAHRRRLLMISFIIPDSAATNRIY